MNRNHEAFSAPQDTSTPRELGRVIELPNQREQEPNEKISIDQKVEKAWKVLSFSPEDDERRFSQFVKEESKNKHLQPDSIPAFRQLERKNTLIDKRMLLAEFLHKKNTEFEHIYQDLATANTLRQKKQYPDLSYAPAVNKLEIAAYWRDSIHQSEEQGALMLEKLYHYLNDTVHNDIDIVQEDLEDMNTLNPAEIIKTLESLEQHTELRATIRSLVKKGAVSHDLNDTSRAEAYSRVEEMIAATTPPADAEKAEALRVRLSVIKSRLLKKVAERLNETEADDMLDNVDDAHLDKKLLEGEAIRESEKRLERLRGIEDVLSKNVYDKELKNRSQELALALYDIGFDCATYYVNDKNTRMTQKEIDALPTGVVPNEKVLLFINPESDTLDSALSSEIHGVTYLNAKKQAVETIASQLTKNSAKAFEALTKSKISFASFDYPISEEAEEMLKTMRSSIEPGKEHPIAIFTKAREAGEQNVMWIKAVDSNDMFVRQQRKENEKVEFQDATNFAGVVRLSLFRNNVSKNA